LNNIQSFSMHSERYARHRPAYPRELFEYLSGLVEPCETAWDCATGNGQAALGLAEFFTRVAATDISPEQIHAHLPHPRVTYGVCAAERAPFADQAFDLICVAQAVHWFDLEPFYRQARRLLKPGGALAVWGYGFFEIEAQIDGLIAKDLLEPIDPYWAAGNRLIMTGYRTLRLPLEQIAAPPAFSMQVEWNLEQLLAYLRTWSAVKRYIAERGDDPVSGLEARLNAAWERPEEVKSVRMPLHLQVGRKPD
jgi:SAM-dependent methyltransferase